MECEFQINTRSPPSSPLLFFFRRGPQKLSGGSHKDGWGSAACSTFLTVDRWWWAFLWQVSVQANTSGTGRIAPLRGVCSKVTIATSPPSLLLSVHSGSFRRGALRFTLHTKKRITSRRRDAPQSRYKMKLRARLPHCQVVAGSLQRPGSQIQPGEG